jgi:hypothetical protein
VVGDGEDCPAGFTAIPYAGRATPTTACDPQAGFKAAAHEPRD